MTLRHTVRCVHCNVTYLKIYNTWQWYLAWYLGDVGFSNIKPSEMTRFDKEPCCFIKGLPDA